MTPLQIIAIVQAADAIAGSVTGRKVLDFLSRDAGLTREQKANLDANYEDLVARAARLRAEIGG